MNYTGSSSNSDLLTMLADVLNQIKYFSFQKLRNLLLVRGSYFLSSLFRKPLVWGKPYFVSLEPTSVCNLSCPQCPVGMGDVHREIKFMDFESTKHIIDEISRTTLMLSLYHQGEPLMHRSITNFIKYASTSKIYTVISTNGQLLSAEVCRGLVEAGLDRIIISLDGTDQASYSQYRRGGDFEHVASGIRLMSDARQAKKRPIIVIQFLVFKHNQEQVDEIKNLGRNLGADAVRIKSAQLEYPENPSQWLPDQSKYRRYRRNKDGEWILKARLKNRCRRLWQTTVITSDGLVLPCCFDKLAKYPMGNTHQESFHQIWKNRKYNDFRKKLLKHRKGTEICTNCTEGIGRIYP